MTTAAEMRDAIYKCLEELPIGQLHKYERYATQTGNLAKFYKSDDDRLNGWNIRRSGFAKTLIGEAFFYVRSTWKVTGYLTLQDADKTELELDLQADLISMALGKDIKFGIGNWFEDYRQTMEAQPVMFCGALCHQVEITFDTMHEQAVYESDSLADFNTLFAQYDLPPHAAAGQYAKWLKEPEPDHSASKPELTQVVNIGD